MGFGSGSGQSLFETECICTSTFDLLQHDFFHLKTCIVLPPVMPWVSRLPPVPELAHLKLIWVSLCHTEVSCEDRPTVNSGKKLVCPSTGSAKFWGKCYILERKIEMSKMPM